MAINFKCSLLDILHKDIKDFYMMQISIDLINNNG